MKTIILYFFPDVSCHITTASDEALDRPRRKTLHSSDATLLLGYLIRDTSIPTPSQSCKRTLRARAVEEHKGAGGKKGRPAVLPTSTSFILKPRWPWSCSLAAKSSIRKQVVCWQIRVHPLLEQKALILGPGALQKWKRTPLKSDHWLLWDTGNGSSPTAHSLLCFLYPSLFILLQPQPLSKPLNQPELNNQLKMAAPGHKQLFNYLFVYTPPHRPSL